MYKHFQSYSYFKLLKSGILWRQSIHFYEAHFVKNFLTPKDGYNLFQHNTGTVLGTSEGWILTKPQFVGMCACDISCRFQGILPKQKTKNHAVLLFKKNNLKMFLGIMFI